MKLHLELQFLKLLMHLSILFILFVGFFFPSSLFPVFIFKYFVSLIWDLNVSTKAIKNFEVKLLLVPS